MSRRKAAEFSFSIRILCGSAPLRRDRKSTEVTDLRYATNLLSWDERVNMPPGGASTHGEMLTTIGRIEHDKFTSDEVGRLIEDATTAAEALGPDAPARRKLAVPARDYDKATRVPGRFVATHAQVSSVVWRRGISKIQSIGFGTPKFQ